MNAIEIKGVTKQYKDVLAVDGLTLNIKKGELFAILGVNGAGKTTTLKIISGLTNVTDGEVYVCGYNVTTQAERVKKMIAISPQNTAVASNLSVRENLAFIAGLYGMGKETTNEKICELNKLLALNEVINRKAGKLSGGWQRRVSVAMALVGDPEILFLDEPTLGLDVIARGELWDIILKLKGKITIILTSHYMNEVEKLADRVGIMKNGKLLNVGTVDEIKAQTGSMRLDDAFISIIKEAK